MQIDLEPDDFRVTEANRGAPLDFGKPSPKETKRETNPLIWGAVLGFAVAILVVLTNVTGGHKSENPLLQTAGSAFGVSFFWGWMAAHIKISIGKWMNERASRRY